MSLPKYKRHDSLTEKSMLWYFAVMRQAELPWCSYSSGILGKYTDDEPNVTATTRGCMHNIFTNKIAVQPTSLTSWDRPNVRQCAFASEIMQLALTSAVTLATGCTMCNVIPVQKHKGQHMWGCVGHILTQTPAMKTITSRDFKAFKRSREGDLIKLFCPDITCKVCILWPPWHAIH